MQRDPTDAELEFEEILVPGYEKVIKVASEKAGLKAIICIHSTALGPAIGGIRIYPYKTFEEALNDVLRLSMAMTYKSAVADCGWGGGKSVIIADPKKNKTKEMLLAFGRAVDSLGGEYVCAEDVGCMAEDIALIRQATPYVVGLPYPKCSGSPSPFAAWGVYRGIQAVLRKIYGSDSVENRTIAIQGVGTVGGQLAKLLFWAGARLIIADLDGDKALGIAELTGAEVVDPSKILAVACDVLAPCAFGGVINAAIIPQLKCRAIAGCANNQLLKDSDADELAAKGILYAPDFVINAGGLINVTEEVEPEGYHPIVARNKTHRLYDQLMEIFDAAERSGISTLRVALSLAEHRLKYGIGKRLNPPRFRDLIE